MGKTTITIKKKHADLLQDYENVLNQNKALMQALCESKENYQTIRNERNELQSENMELIIKNRDLNNRLLKINTWSRSLLDTALKGSELTSNIIYQSHCENVPGAPYLGDTSLNDGNNNSPTKTQAVKPMVCGHVINRPIINLPRVPTEELVRLGSSNHDCVTRASLITPPSISEASNYATVESGAGEGSHVNAPDSLTRRLTTLQEMDELSPQSSRNIPLLSGIFNDVRVYLSPSDRVCPAQINNQLAPAILPTAAMKRNKKRRTNGSDQSSLSSSSSIAINDGAECPPADNLEEIPVPKITRKSIRRQVPKRTSKSSIERRRSKPHSKLTNKK